MANVLLGTILTSLRARRSSGVSFGSLGVSAFLSALSLLFLDLDLDLAADSSLALGVDVPLVAFGVDDVLSLILGFFTESER